MPRFCENERTNAVPDHDVYIVRTYEKEPNFILMAIVALAIFLIITSYLGK